MIYLFTYYTETCTYVLKMKDYLIRLPFIIERLNETQATSRKNTDRTLLPAPVLT